MRPYASRNSSPSSGRSYEAVLTRMRRQLKAAMSTPVASSPDSSAWTSVVPEPWDELAVVRVEAMDVLRPLALAQLGLRPREVEVQRRVQLVLRDGHGG